MLRKLSLLFGLVSATNLMAVETPLSVTTLNFGIPGVVPSQFSGNWSITPQLIPANEIPMDSSARSMAFDEKSLEFSLKGLKPEAHYMLELKYLADAPGREQAVYVDGNLVREQFSLPAKKIFSQKIRLTKSAIADGAINIAIQQRLGPNVILSSATLYSDTADLAKNIDIQFYGTKNHITGTAIDINNKNPAAEGVSITAKLGTETLTAKTDANGRFSIALPKKWLANDRSEISLSSDTSAKVFSFKVAKLNNDSYYQELLDNSCHDPFELAIAKNGHIFYIERQGALKRVLPVTKSSKTIATIPVYSKLDDGLLGLALDPKFSENGWLYLCYSAPKTSENFVSRFTLKNDALVEGSEKILLKIPTQRDVPPCHTGGSLAFDSQGNLYISTGDYTNPFKSQGYAPTDEQKGRKVWDAQATSADTSSLMGKILKITPQADGTYSIPKGNLFVNKGPKARPEIYVMGCRNPFRITVNQKTGTLYWGEVGPDSGATNKERGPAGHDEFNQAKKAGNYGWPHFVGNNIPYTKYDFITKSTELRNPKAPKNNSINNGGLSQLPAAQPALIYYPNAATSTFPIVGSGGRCAMGGPVYHFDSTSSSPSKLSETYDNTFFAYDWMRGWILACKLDENEKITEITRFMPKFKFKRPMDLEIGPDGSMYLMEWGSNYGGSNPDAKITKLTPGVHLNKVASIEIAPEQEEKNLLNKFTSALKGGDAKAGKALFLSPKAGCVYCHKSDEPGGIVGPALAHIGSKFGRQDLLESVILPSKKIEPPYLNVTITMLDGKVHNGTPTADGAHHITLDTSDGKTLKLDKAKIKTTVNAPSPMPEGAGMSLSPTEMQDLIAYLSTLKEK